MAIGDFTTMTLVDARRWRVARRVGDGPHGAEVSAVAAKGWFAVAHWATASLFMGPRPSCRLTL
jgi:hypothetical protein